eukprot:5283591-Alexandrium_andersonii.AAC.1
MARERPKGSPWTSEPSCARRRPCSCSTRGGGGTSGCASRRAPPRRRGRAALGRAVPTVPGGDWQGP